MPFMLQNIVESINGVLEHSHWELEEPQEMEKPAEKIKSA